MYTVPYAQNNKLYNLFIKKYLTLPTPPFAKFFFEDFEDAKMLSSNLFDVVTIDAHYL